MAYLYFEKVKGFDMWLYVVALILNLVEAGGIAYIFRRDGNFFFIVVMANNIFSVMFILAAVPLIMIGKYSLLYNLVVCLIAELSVLVIHRLFCGRCKRKLAVRRTNNEVIYILSAGIVFMLLRIGSEEISSYGDMGAYFQHVILMLRGSYSSRLALKELYSLSASVDSHIQEMMYGTFSVFEGNIYQLHGIGTWCIFPALFAKIFGLFNYMYGVKYLFLLSFFNILYGVETRIPNRINIFIPVMMIGTAPLMLYIGKSDLSEIAIFFLLSVGIVGIFTNFDSMWGCVFSGIAFGSIALVHASGLIYIPIFMIVFFCGGVLIHKYRFRFLLVNCLMGIILIFSMWYVNKVAPRYCIQQYGVISNRLHLNLIGTFLLLDMIIVIALLIQFLVYKGKMKCINVIVKKFFEHYRLFSIVGICIIVGFTVYYGGFLCFSERFVVNEKDYATSTWKLRNTYVNTGITALSYLNLTNILRATSMLGGIIFFLLPLRKKRINIMFKLLYFATSLVMMVFTIYKWDTPINYYASRYLAPILIPLIVVTLTICLNNRRVVLILLMTTWIYNKQYFPSMLTCATHYGQYEILRDALNNIEENAVVLFDTESDVLPSTLLSDLRILNDNYCYSLEDYEEVISAYLGEKDIYIVSKNDISQLYRGIKPVFSKIYISQYSLGHGENGTYGKISGTYEIGMSIYEVTDDGN